MEREASLTKLPIATWCTVARDEEREREREREREGEIERERERDGEGHRHRGDPTIGSCLFGKSSCNSAHNQERLVSFRATVTLRF